jgi:hypothetical protein
VAATKVVMITASDERILSDLICGEFLEREILSTAGRDNMLFKRCNRKLMSVGAIELCRARDGGERCRFLFVVTEERRQEGKEGGTKEEDGNSGRPCAFIVLVSPGRDRGPLDVLGQNMHSPSSFPGKLGRQSRPPWIAPSALV